MLRKSMIQVSTVVLCVATALLMFSSGDDADDSVRFSGMCDASAAVALDDVTFIAADDERNTLYVYRADQPGAPVQTIPWDGYLGIDPERDDHPEVDIEGAAVLDGRIYWISSHGRNKDGKWRPNRHRFFAMSVSKDGSRWVDTPFGRPYRELAVRLVHDRRMQRLGLDRALQAGEDKAESLAPKDEGFNIEGLCAVPDSGHLLIALRNPRPNNKAVLVPLCNPVAVLSEGATPEFGNPIQLDLSFKSGEHTFHPGIRSITYFARVGAYLIVAGPHNEKKVFAVFRWSGKPEDAPQLLCSATDAVNEGHAFCPEALIVYPEDGRVQTLSDDGSQMVRVNSAAECKKGTFQNGQCEAKNLLDDRRKTFRSILLAIE